MTYNPQPITLLGAQLDHPRRFGLLVYHVCFQYLDAHRFRFTGIFVVSNLKVHVRTGPHAEPSRLVVASRGVLLPNFELALRGCNHGSIHHLLVVLLPGIVHGDFTRNHIRHGIQQQLRPHVEQVRQHRRGLFVGTDLVLLLGHNRPGVHLGHGKEDRHANGLIASLEGTLDRTGTAPPWQQAGMDVEGAKLRHGQKSLRQILPIRGRNAQIGPHIVLQCIQKVLILGLFGTEDGYVELLGHEADRTGNLLAATFAPLGRLGDNAHHLEGTRRIALGGIVEGLEGRCGHFGRAEENDARLPVVVVVVIVVGGGGIVGAGAGIQPNLGLGIVVGSSNDGQELARELTAPLAAPHGV